MGNQSNIPTVDLSVFFRDGEEEGKMAAKEIISRACAEYGFFQAVGHGVPLELMSRAMDLSKAFFAKPTEVKLKYAAGADAPVPAGYGKQPALGTDKNEFLMMLPPHNGFNFQPNYPPEFRGVQEELFRNLRRTGEVIVSILNDCLGLPPNFLNEYNQDRRWDLMTTKHYFPATETENVGISKHEDGNIITFVFQDDVGGLEVLRDGHWIPLLPSCGTLVVNLGDVIQVLTNKKFKSATHRVVRKEGRRRFSYLFFYSLEGDKWVEPLPHFTTEIGEAPKYRGFLYKDYLSLRLRNKTHPPSSPEDEINITHYEI
ncbi:hypothetical protein ACS0TY_034509 [Phlomoides rotata]